MDPKGKPYADATHFTQVSFKSLCDAVVKNGSSQSRFESEEASD